MWIQPNFDGMLPELKDVPHWVLAKAVVRDGKTTKPPYQPNGQPASHSNPATWSTFAAVKEAYERGGFIGVGFVLDGKPPSEVATCMGSTGITASRTAASILPFKPNSTNCRSPARRYHSRGPASVGSSYTTNHCRREGGISTAGASNFIRSCAT
jgi:hypothetical protein